MQCYLLRHSAEYKPPVSILVSVQDYVEVGFLHRIPKHKEHKGDSDSDSDSCWCLCSFCSVRCDIMTCNAYNRGYCAHSQNNATLMIGAPQGSSPLDIVIEPTM